MHVSAFDYHLPPELIAQSPARQRDESRMLILDKKTGDLQDSSFRALPGLLSPGSLVVINNSRVFPARLFGRRRGFSGRIEILLLRRVEGTVWEALGKPARALRTNTELVFRPGMLTATVIRTLGRGHRLIQFDCHGKTLDAIIDKLGQTPLPPYIKTSPQPPPPALSERYQTIYAQARGSIAAPTAGLHFTESIFQQLLDGNNEIVEITHHVGYATFQPVRVERVENHQLDFEDYLIPRTTAARINKRRPEHQTVLAVGSTTVRTLESATDEAGYLRPGPGRTNLFIYPGYRFKTITALLTNFHLPQSSLLMLVCALAGTETVLNAYRYAVEQRYRFYSFGDCMLII